MTSTKLYRLTLFIGLAILLTPIAGMAAITFNPGPGGTIFQQTINSPCVIGNNSCNQPGGFPDFESANGAGGGGTYDFSSPVYVASAANPFSFIGNLIPTVFTIGLDTNIAGNGQPSTLESLVFFKTFSCPAGATGAGSATGVVPAGCTVDAGNSYIPGTLTAVPDNHNGNGFSDVTLTGFSLAAGTKYVFEASISNDTDGMEQFFIIPGVPVQAVVPEPRFISLLLFGAMLIATIYYRKRASVQ